MKARMQSGLIFLMVALTGALATTDETGNQENADNRRLQLVAAPYLNGIRVTPPSRVMPSSATETSTAPSDVPSMVPSDVPSMVPSDIPSMVPSDIPSMVPSLAPTKSPTMGSDYPSIVPTGWGTPKPTTDEDVWAPIDTRRLAKKISHERKNWQHQRLRMR